jgi:hypothetical protein
MYLMCLGLMLRALNGLCWHFTTTLFHSNTHQLQRLHKTLLTMAKLGIADSEDTRHQVRVAVTQAEPKWLDLQGSVDKTCALIIEAAKGGAEMLAFPECWVTGYPAWIW